MACMIFLSDIMRWRHFCWSWGVGFDVLVASLVFNAFCQLFDGGVVVLTGRELEREIR